MARAVFDVIVVGAGAIGATTAYLLRREGVKVALVDRGPVGHEASWASAGMIQPSGTRADPSWFARATQASRALYDDLDRDLHEQGGERIGLCGEGGLVIALDDREAEVVQRFVRGAAGEAAPPRLLDAAEARAREPSLPARVVAAALRPDHRALDARRYTAVVARAARARGAALRERLAVTGLVWRGRKVHGVIAGGEPLAASLVINAAGAWAGRLDPKLPLPIGPDHGQIQALDGRPGDLRHNLQRIGAGGYITPRPDGRIIVGATSDDFGYEKKVTPDGLRALARIAREIVPDLAGRRVLASWSGLRPGSPDGLPVIGRDPRADGGYLWAAGHGGYGIMQAPATAQVLVDLALGRPPRIAVEGLSAARFSP